jgi:membrane fusion protein (multidrug efflux system)
MNSFMRKMLLVLSILFILVFGWWGLKKMLFHYFMSHYSPPPITVSSTEVTSQTWQNKLSSIGTLSAIKGTELSFEVSGTIREIRFESGATVTAGDELVLLDSSVEQATLQSDLAKLQLAQLTHDRNHKLKAKNAVSQAATDSSLADLHIAMGVVEYDKARIKQKTLTAPFSGKIGIKSISLGQYLPAGTSIASLQTLSTLYVKFSLPEQYASELHPNQKIEVSVNVSGVTKKIIGKIVATNSKVSETTRNILLLGIIPNENTKLLPGMFANVTVWLQKSDNVLTIPQTAITYSLHGDSVFLIQPSKKQKNKADLTVIRQYIKVGEQRDTSAAILDGLHAGDAIVTAGQLKLQNNAHIEIDNSVGIQ